MKVAIIGSGIVGLTLAHTLTEKNIEVTIFEKEKDSLSHGTGRNSGVIHSGIYYQPNTLRSNLCIKGAKLMKKFIVDNNLYINNCGKLLLPKTKNDIETLNLLYERSKEVGVEAQKLNSIEEITRIEPNCNPLYNDALFIKDTAIADPKEVSNKLIEILKKRNVIIKYGFKVDEISSENTSITIKGNINKFDFIINSAGLHADHLAKKADLETDYTSLPFKGKYWKINFSDKNEIPNRLIYPVPNLDYPFLGIHTVYDKAGNFYLGPSNTPVFGREAYKPFYKFNLLEFLNLSYKFILKIFFNENNLRNLAISEFKNLFLFNVRKSSNVYFKHNPSNIELSSKVGIRSQIFDKKSKKLFNDFVVIKQNNIIHILNAISPAWTSSFAMADFICEKYNFK